MNKFFLFLWALSSTLILCQWFVITSLRKYLFAFAGPLKRRHAYTILAVLGLVNVLGVLVSMDGARLAMDSASKKIAAVAFFSYLGLGLFLALFFLLLKMCNGVISIAGKVLWSSVVTEDLRRIAENERGCVSSPCGEPQSIPGHPRLKHEGAHDSSLPLAGMEKAEDSCGESAGVTRSGEPGMHRMKRRSFLKVASVSGLAAGTALLGEGIAEAYQEPVKEDWDVVHPRLETGTGPVVMIHATDFHFGLFYNARDLADLVEMLNSMDGDAVVFTGDIYHSPLTPVEDSIPILEKLKERRIGNFAVLGNHEFYAGISRCVAALESAGIRLLRNEWHTFSDNGATIHIGGLDDPVKDWLRGRDFPKFSYLMKTAPSAPGMKVLLCHRPTILPEAAMGGIDLVLSGHTHGGQFILPSLFSKRGVSIARLVSPFTHGWYREGSTHMYLNRGVGLTFVPWRINCPPEIAVFRLGSSNGNVRAPRISKRGRDASGKTTPLRKV